MTIRSRNVLRFIAVLQFTPLLALTGCASIKQMGRDPSLEGDPKTTGMLILSCEMVANFQDRGLISMGLGVNNRAYANGGTIRDAYGHKVEGRAASRVVVFSGLSPGTYTVMDLLGKQGLDDNAKKAIYDCPRSKDAPGYQSLPPETCVSYIEIALVIPPERQPDYTFEIAPGDVVYGGKLTFDEPHDPPFGNREERKSDSWMEGTHVWDVHSHPLDAHAEFVVTDEDKRQALEAVRDSFRDGPWLAVVEEQLSTLTLQTSP